MGKKGVHWHLARGSLNMIIFCEDCGTRYSVNLDAIQGCWHSFHCRECGFMITLSKENPTELISADVVLQKQSEEHPVAGVKKRVLVVDDSKLFRGIIKEILEFDGTLEVVGEAADGDEAVRLNQELAPDVITLDVNIPGMGGASTSQYLMLFHPCPVVIVSNLSNRSQDTIIDFLRLGAVDFLIKPKGEDDREEIQHRFVTAVHNAAKAKVDEFTSFTLPGAISTQVKPTGHSIPSRQLAVVVSGAGGIAELLHLFGRFPSGFDGTVMVVQRMPEAFISSLVEYINQISRIPVLPMSEGMPLLVGQGYIGTPKTANQLCERKGQFFLTRLELPSSFGDEQYDIDSLLCSAAETFVGPVSLTLLSGSTCSLQTLRYLQSKSGTIIVKQPETCVVRDSLETIVKAGLADAEVLPDVLVETIIEHLQLECTAVPDLNGKKTVLDCAQKRRHQRIFFTLQTGPQCNCRFSGEDVPVLQAQLLDLSESGVGFAGLKDRYGHRPVRVGETITICSLAEGFPELNILTGVMVEIRWMQEMESSRFIRYGGALVHTDTDTRLHLQEVVAKALEMHLKVLSTAYA
ncbi:MAG: hypothetical protein CSA33_04595 [Desulfobulbus propionicus]|nr:MAG: hypothetical protein CSA33_04595 [Desulfobulbus propionicus]